jgi:hypothetical protein
MLILSMLIAITFPRVGSIIDIIGGYCDMVIGFLIPSIYINSNCVYRLRIVQIKGNDDSIVWAGSDVWVL